MGLEILLAYKIAFSRPFEYDCGASPSYVANDWRGLSQATALKRVDVDPHVAVNHALMAPDGPCNATRRGIALGRVLDLGNTGKYRWCREA